MTLCIENSANDVSYVVPVLIGCWYSQVNQLSQAREKNCKYNGHVSTCCKLVSLLCRFGIRRMQIRQVWILSFA